MMSIDSTIVSTALDSLQHGLGTSINWAGWTITAYALGFTLMLPISGKLSEQYGCLRVFLGSVAIFTAASLCCGLVDNIFLLIALRAVQAAGGAGLTPSATQIIVDHFGNARDRAVSLFGSVFPVGAMIGPIFGGLFVSYWSWRGIFFVNVPIGITVIILSLRYIPRDPTREQGTHLDMDPIGVALLGAGILLSMFAVSYLGGKHVSALSAEFILPLVAGVAALWGFFHHIKRAGQPFITPLLIYGPGFGAVNLINAVYVGVAGGVIALLPLYAADRYRIDALNSGLLLIAQGAAAIVFSIVATLTLRRTGYRPPLLVGGVLTVVGIVLLALRPLGGASPILWLAATSFLIGAGGGIVNPPSRNAGLQLVPEHSATVAAIRSVCLEVGSIIMISAATAVLASAHAPGIAGAWCFIASALVLLISLPLIARIPEHRGSW